jgi:hypothetical protein
MPLKECSIAQAFPIFNEIPCSHRIFTHTDEHVKKENKMLKAVAHSLALKLLNELQERHKKHGLSERAE